MEFMIFFISKILNELPIVFTETLKIINILLTLHLTTVSNKRFFLPLNELKPIYA
jgi:hypothetical protein